MRLVDFASPPSPAARACTSHRRCLLVALLAAAVCTLGCGRPFVAATPASFVELEDQQPAFDYRATSADGVVMAIRAIDNRPKGDAAFWLQALENRMQGTDGYALLGRREVTCLDGHKGTQLRYGRDEGSTPHLYVITLFVTDARIFVLEAGGTRTQVERYAAPIDWAVANFRPQ